MKNIVDQKTRFKKIPYFEVFILCFMGFFMFYFYCTDFSSISDDFLKAWENIASPTFNDLYVMRNILQRPRWNPPFKRKYQ